MIPWLNRIGLSILLVVISLSIIVMFMGSVIGFVTFGVVFIDHVVFDGKIIRKIYEGE